jgi:hypothetical protein
MVKGLTLDLHAVIPAEMTLTELELRYKVQMMVETLWVNGYRLSDPQLHLP